jgi:hypothetical protein
MHFSNLFLNYPLLETLIFSKKSFLKLRKEVESLQMTKINDYELFEMVEKFEKQEENAKKIYFLYIFIELSIVFSNFTKNVKIDFYKHRLNPYLRVLLVSKLYYLYFIFKFKKLDTNSY